MASRYLLIIARVQFLDRDRVGVDGLSQRFGENAPDRFRPRGSRLGLRRDPCVEPCQLVWFETNAD